MNLLNIPESRITSESKDCITYDFNLCVFERDDKVRFEINGIATSWMDSDDDFITRIQFENLNRRFLAQHLTKEIEIRNILDEGIGYLEGERYRKAIGCFDEAIYYDESYAEALLLKSRALFGQRHFIKSLRFYNRAIKANPYLKDMEYHKSLVEKSKDERNSLPKIKFHIFIGDEHFSRGDFAKAIESYDRALACPSKFKEKILHKLLSKKGTAFFNLNKFGNALVCFKKSLNARKNDYAYFMKGYCEYNLGMALDDSFLRPLDISKYQRLCRALILNEVKMYGDAIKCIDELLSCHFTEDKLYFIALTCKLSAMQSLGMDVADQKDLIDSFLG